MGGLLSEGNVVPQDLEKARLWYAQAASQGSAKARDELEKLGGAAALPDGGQGLIAADQGAAGPAKSAKPVGKSDSGQLDPESRAAIVKRRIEELKSARKGETNPVAPVAIAGGAAATAAAVTAASAGDTVADADAGPDTLEMDELVLEEFATDAGGSDEILVLDDTGQGAGDEGVDISEMDVMVEAMPAQAVAEPITASEPSPASSDTDNAPLAATAERAHSDGLKGRDWVQSRDPAHYTIQLLGSWNEGDALAFVEANPLPGVGAILQTSRHGKPWFSIYYGDFASYSKAVATQSALSGGIAKHGPWVRPFHKIQVGIK
jgi:septal ring-binding cell division protein DamX